MMHVQKRSPRVCLVWVNSVGDQKCQLLETYLHTLSTRYMYLHTADFEYTNLLRCKREVIRMEGFDIYSLQGRDARL